MSKNSKFEPVDLQLSSYKLMF